MDGAAGAAAGAGVAVERTCGQKASFDVGKRPTRWWGRCSTTV